MSLSNINLGTKMRTLDIGKKRAAYTGVIVHAGQTEDGQEIDYSVGDDTGSVLEVTVPNGSLALAYMLLDKLKLRGYQYQPFEADGAIADPAIEIGDNITANNVPSIVMGINTNHSRLMASTLKAPYDEEVNHEWKYVPRSERQFKRESAYTRSRLTINSDAIKAEVERASRNEGELRATLMVQAEEISAKVSQTGGNNSSFGWSLRSDEFGLYAGSQKVFYVNSSGAHVKGEITATSGEIGGFHIGSSAIWNSISQFGGPELSGVYIGTNGIQLGQGFQVNASGSVYASNLSIVGGYINIGSNFIVDPSGNLTANSGSFRGNVSAKNIQYGGDYGTFHGGGLTNYSIGSNAMGDGSIINRTIGGSAVSYGKVDFTGTLDQVGVNKSNIEAMNGYFTGSATFSNLKANVIWLDNKYLYFDAQNYVRGGTSD